MNNLWRKRLRIRFAHTVGIFRPRERLGSYPFISGDTFRSLCQVVIEGESGAVSSYDIESIRSSPLTFCEVHRVTDLTDSTLGSKEGNTLIIHNGDVLPSADVMLGLTTMFSRVYSVNWLLGGEIEAIPIGLENRRWGMHGHPRLFSKRHQIAGRSVDVLVSFSDGTNASVRKAAREAFRQLPGVNERDFLRQSSYVECLRRSRFVVSPPGNGPDCHRTWEAIYAGAVPIVLRSAWPKSWNHLPVMVVDHWEEAVERIATNADIEFRALRALDARMAYFPFWFDQLSH